MTDNKKENNKILLALFLTFLKLGAITFGGGYVMLTLIRDEFVDKKKWVTEDELLQVYAVAESTPGPVAINAATYIGAKMRGFFGAVVATFAVVLPAFIVSFVIATYLNFFMQYQIVKNAFLGIKAGVAVLIFLAGVDMLKKMEKTAFNIAVAVISFIAMVVIDIFSIDFSSIYIILFFGVLSLLIFCLGKRKNKSLKNKSEVADKVEKLDDRNNNIVAEDDENKTLNGNKSAGEKPADEKPADEDKSVKNESKGDKNKETTQEKEGK